MNDEDHELFNRQALPRNPNNHRAKIYSCLPLELEGQRGLGGAQEARGSLLMEQVDFYSATYALEQCCDQASFIFQGVVEASYSLR